MKKLGVVTIEGLVVIGLVVTFSIYMLYLNQQNTAETLEEINASLVQSGTYLGEQVIDAYTSDYGGVDLDDGWSSDGGVVEGIIPSYTLVSSITTDDVYYINVGEEITVGVGVFPTNATVATLSWQVSTGSANVLVTRDTLGHTGTIKGVSSGLAKITLSATDGSGVTKTFYVNVTQTATGLTLDKEDEILTLSYGGLTSLIVTATVLPDTGDSIASEQRVSWSFGNGGANSECFSLDPDYTTNTVVVSLRGTALEDYCTGKTVLIYAETADGGFTKSFQVTIE